MPSTNSNASSAVTKAPATGFGIASRTAVTLGRNATAANTSPMHTPTARDATPVSSVTATLVE